MTTNPTGTPGSQQTPIPPAPTTRRPRRSIALAGVVGLLVIGGLGAAAVASASRDDDRTVVVDNLAGDHLAHDNPAPNGKAPTSQAPTSQAPTSQAPADPTSPVAPDPTTGPATTGGTQIDATSDAGRAAAAALAAVGGVGAVTEVERSDDPTHAWEVEIRNGRYEVDVYLDASFKVLAKERWKLDDDHD